MASRTGASAYTLAWVKHRWIAGLAIVALVIAVVGITRYRHIHNLPKVVQLTIDSLPAGAKVIIDRAAKRYVLKYHMDRCVYCGQCVVNCKVKCMGMTHEDWEHAKIKKDFTVYYGKEEDVAQSLANVPATVDSSAK